MAQSKSTRRDFLRGGAAVDALAAWADGAAVDAHLVEPLAEPGLLVFTRRAMATSFEVLVDGRAFPQAADAALAGFDVIDALEDQLSVYREHSEVMHINRLAHEGPVVVEPRLFALFLRAAELHAATGGAFDITAGPLAKVWGFYRRQGAIPAPADLAEALGRVGMSRVLLDEETTTIEFSREGIEINLGAIGKGYALDRAAEVLVAAGIDNFVLHGGASSVLARGSCRHTSAGPSGWRIGVGDPQRPGERLALVNLRDRAIGTSGAAYQSFRHQGRRYGHILDPRTGWPAEGVLSATVLAETAADADALSTALYVLGPDAADQFLSGREDIAAILVLPGQRPGEAIIRTWNLPDSDFELADKT
ncbi:MAG: FAD:protein FMN transferase [Planctomycetota bacterium]|nr:MAG: FAD:protein FMN transferase [Planctomycetota bacterium]